VARQLELQDKSVVENGKQGGNPTNKDCFHDLLAIIEQKSFYFFGMQAQANRLQVINNDEDDFLNYIHGVITRSYKAKYKIESRRAYRCAQGDIVYLGLRPNVGYQGLGMNRTQLILGFYIMVSVYRFLNGRSLTTSP
jgi:hypothetical protein